MAFIDGEYIGLNGQKIAAIYDTVTGQFHQKQVLYDASGNAVASVLVNSVRTLAVSAVNDVAVKGNMLLGDLTTGARPVFVGGQVRAGMAQYDISTTGDAKFQSFSLTANGRLLTLEGAPPEDKGLPSPVLAVDDTAVHTLVPAPVATVLLELDALEVANLSATPNVAILYSSQAPTIEIYRCVVPATPGRLPFRLPNPPRTAKGAALTYKLTSSPGANQMWLMPHYHITQE